MDDPDRPAITWLPSMDEPGVVTTYGALDAAAGEVAAAVRRMTRTGDRIVLLAPPGPRFVAAFLGCLYASRVPVPVYPVLHSIEGAATISRIAKDCGATLAWTTDARSARTAAELLGIPAEWRTDPGVVVLPENEPDFADIAFLQYTSGSTDCPKGVTVTHGNLAANVTSIADSFGHDRNEVVLSWLPAYHDMGLIGNILHPLHLGCGAILCAPTAFIRRPLSWLTAIDRLGVTTTGAPNFAYDLVVAAAERHGVPDVDLGRWRVAYSGAEPVAPSTVRRFADLLACRGFDPRAVVPCYGLAEATLLVSCVRPGTGVSTRRLPEAAEVASCGAPRGCDVVIADDDGRELEPGVVGEIRVSGPSVTAGYWGQGQDASFAGPITGRAGSWLRTGDLGFLADGELHVTGRRKDVIIVRGRNHYPHDIERLAADLVPALRPGLVIAFPSRDGQGVVIVGECRPGAEIDAEDVARVGRAVADAHGLVVRDVLAVPRHGIPRTTSGKLRRSAARRRYETGEYGSTTGTPAGAGPGAVDVPALVAEALGRPLVDSETLTAAGLDSLRAVWLSGALNRAGLDVPVIELLSGITLAELTARAPRRDAAEAPASAELSSGQQALVFLDRLDPGSDEYTISVAWELDAAVDVAAFDRALGSALAAAPQLTRRVVAEGATLRLAPVDERSWADAITAAPVAVDEDALAATLTDTATRPFAIETGPLARLHVWQTPVRRVHQLVVHHLVTDLWSLGLLLTDIVARYAGADPDELGTPAVDRYPSYVADQERYLSSTAAAQRDDYLRGLIPAEHPPLEIRTDRPHGPRRDRRGGRVRTTLPAEIGAALAERDRVALLTALWGVCLYRYGATGPIVVGVPVAGRPSGGHATISGLCTNTAPLAIAVDPAQSLDALAKATRAQLLAAVDAGLYPLARAVKVLRPARAVGRMPVVETLVAVQESPVHQVPDLMAALADGEWVDLGGLRLRPIEVPRRTCRYDLDLVITPRARGGDLVTLDYSAHLFDQSTATDILATYVAMVTAAATARTVADTFVLPPDQRARYDQAGRSGSRYDDAALAGELLDLIAAKAPHRPAVSDGTTEIDFAEFTARVDRLAAALTEVGTAR